MLHREVPLRAKPLRQSGIDHTDFFSRMSRHAQERNVESGKAKIFFSLLRHDYLVFDDSLHQIIFYYMRHLTERTC